MPSDSVAGWDVVVGGGVLLVVVVIGVGVDVGVAVGVAVVDESVGFAVVPPSVTGVPVVWGIGWEASEEPPMVRSPYRESVAAYP